LGWWVCFGGGGEGFMRVATRESFFVINEDNSAATRLRVKIESTTVAFNCSVRK
jgi:hypothetical protein